MVMLFPAKKNAGYPKAPRHFLPRNDGILPPPRQVALGFSSTPFSPPPPPESVRTDADVRTKIFRTDRLPDFFTHGVPLARGSSAIKKRRNTDCQICSTLDSTEKRKSGRPKTTWYRTVKRELQQ